MAAASAQKKTSTKGENHNKSAQIDDCNYANIHEQHYNVKLRVLVSI